MKNYPTLSIISGGFTPPTVRHRIKPRCRGGRLQPFLPNRRCRANLSAMDDQSAPKTVRDKLLGYYAVPHELLHVVAYWLIGKPYQYRLGALHVRALAPETETRRETLFVLLLPFVVFFGLGLLCQVLWVLSAFFITIPPDRYFIDGPTWHFIFPTLGLLLLIYSGTSRLDLLMAYHLLFRKDEPQDQRPHPHRKPQNKGDQGH